MDSKPLLPAEHTHTTRNTPEARTCVINRAHFSPLQPPPLPFFMNLICCRFDRISMSSYCSCLHMVPYVYFFERRCPYSSSVCSGHFIGGLFQGVSFFVFFLEFPTQIDEGTCILRHWSVWRGIMIRGRPDWCGFVSVMRTTVTVPHPSCPDPTWPDRVPRAGIKDRTLIPDYQIISSPCVRPHVIINPP